MPMRLRVLSLLIPLLLVACDRPTDPIEPVAASGTVPAASAPTPAPGLSAMSAAADVDPMSTAAHASMHAAASAQIMLQPTVNNTASGTLSLSVENGALRLSGRISGIGAGGEHGFHVHEHGDCSAPDASSAGGHFNPSSAPHGQAGVGPHHAGDLPNLIADAQGAADVNLLLADLELGSGGPRDAVGRALVLHEKRDDYSTQPSGDSGARIACGVIQSMTVSSPPMPVDAAPSPPANTP